MVISNSRVNMASSRTYSQTSGKRYLTSYSADSISGSGSSFSSQYSLTRHFLRNGKQETYSQQENLSQHTMYGIFSYAKDGSASGISMAPAAQTILIPNTAYLTRLKSPEEMYDEVNRKTLRSILELLKRIHFKTHFTDETAFQNEYSQYENSQNEYFQNKYSSYFEEQECTCFSSQGTAVTTDGREISFDINIEMSRSFSETFEFEYIHDFSKVLTDPLVISLDSNPASISEQTFFFDLDMDGNEEEIHNLGNGCGFLALDKNGDGIINDGSELFGTKSGNGFADLACYDSDGNEWIDENDLIFNSLKVWTKDVNGNDKLLSLKEANVGAIYLGNSKTDFTITDLSNNTMGQVRQTGIYIKESGEVDAIQQIDL